MTIPPPGYGEDPGIQRPEPTASDGTVEPTPPTGGAVDGQAPPPAPHPFFAPVNPASSAPPAAPVPSSPSLPVPSAGPPPPLAPSLPPVAPVPPAAPFPPAPPLPTPLASPPPPLAAVRPSGAPLPPVPPPPGPVGSPPAPPPPGPVGSPPVAPPMSAGQPMPAAPAPAGPPAPWALVADPAALPATLASVGPSSAGAEAVSPPPPPPPALGAPESLSPPPAPPLATVGPARFAMPVRDDVSATAAIFGGPGAPEPPEGGEPNGPADSRRNWLGLTSFIASLLGGGLIAIALGHLGLRAAARGKATNRGIALAGTILGYVGVVVLCGALVATGALAGVFPLGSSAPQPSVTITPLSTSGVPAVDSTLTVADRWFGLAIGDCVLEFDTGVDPADPTIEKPEVVPCSGAHFGEVYAIADIEGDTLPSDATFRLHSREVCAGPLFSSYVGVEAYEDSGLLFDVLYPAERSWENGTHQMVCLLVETGGSTTGSLKGSAR